jgi:hypothetical protein
MHKLKVTVTTDGSGDAVAYSPRVAGKIHSVAYVKPGSASYADGVDFTITSEATGEQIWVESNVNATAYRYPRAATHSNAGVAALYAAAGTAVQDKIALAADRIKIVVAQGGAAKVGAFHFCIE